VPVAAAPAPVAVAPAAIPAASLPTPLYSVVPPAVPVAPLALGMPCVASPLSTPCIAGAVCSEGICTCGPAYVPAAGTCFRRRRAKPVDLKIKDRE
uniref:EB domain-containing protein n=1 Tax=Syphacia muris TaxID=451379 RepID=A0A0N5A7W5_9BILA